MSDKNNQTEISPRECAVHWLADNRAKFLNAEDVEVTNRAGRIIGELPYLDEPAMLTAFAASLTPAPPSKCECGHDWHGDNPCTWTGQDEVDDGVFQEVHCECALSHLVIPSEFFPTLSPQNESFWVVERFENGRSAGYWTGASSRDFTADIEKAVQFHRKDDAFWATRGWHWRDTKLTEHVMLATLTPPQPAPWPVTILPDFLGRQVEQAIAAGLVRDCWAEIWPKIKPSFDKMQELLAEPLKYALPAPIMLTPQPENSSWILCSERLPEPPSGGKRKWYWITDGELYDVAIIIHGKFSGHRDLEATHWREIEPAAPPSQETPKPGNKLTVSEIDGILRNAFPKDETK